MVNILYRELNYNRFKTGLRVKQFHKILLNTIKWPYDKLPHANASSPMKVTDKYKTNVIIRSDRN